MAITRLHQCGFEYGATITEMSISSATFVVGSTSRQKTGSYSGRISGAGTDAYIFYTHSSTTSQARTSFYFNHSGPSAGDTPNIFVAKNGSTPILTLEYDAVGGNFKIYSGSSAGTLLDTQSVPSFSTTNNWFHIGIDFKLDNSGWFYVYLDGVAVISFTGDTNDAGAVMDTFFYGADSSTDTFLNFTYYDDIYIDDTTGEGAPAVVPSYQFELIRPDADGYSSAWTPSTGTNHYALVDETPPNTTDYITTASAANIDAFSLGTYTTPVGRTISAVIPQAYALKVDAGGTVNLKVGTRLSGSNSMSGTKTLTTSYKHFYDRQTTKPGGGSWTDTDVNNSELVIESV